MKKFKLYTVNNDNYSKKKICHSEDYVHMMGNKGDIYSVIGEFDDSNELINLLFNEELTRAAEYYSYFPFDDFKFDYVKQMDESTKEAIELMFELLDVEIEGKVAE